MREAHSVLGPSSPQAAAIAHLAWIFFGVAALVWLAVLGSLTVALLRPHGLGERDVDPQLTRRHRNVASGALGLSAGALLVLGGGDYSTGRGTETRRGAAPEPARV